MQAKTSFHSSIRRSAAVLLLPLMLALPFTANAAFIDFTGTVTDGGTGTIPAPFNAGDPLTGLIQLNDAAATPGAMFTRADLQDFDFTIGSVNFNFANSMPFGFFNGTVSDDGTTLSDFNASTNFGAYPNCSTCNLVLNGDADSFVVTVSGFPNFGVANGTLASTVRDANNVPEPPAILVFALGLILLGWGVRQRQRG